MLVEKNNTILHKASTQVGPELLADNGRGLKPIASLLIEQLSKHQAVGVSACQIGIDLAMFAVDVDHIVKVCVNPQIVAASSDMEKGLEGCLSFPDLWLKVNRPAAVVVRYLNIDANEVTEQLDGFMARAWLHEFDHTNGICFTNRVSKLSLDMANRKLNKKNRRMAQ